MAGARFDEARDKDACTAALRLASSSTTKCTIRSGLAGGIWVFLDILPQECLKVAVVPLVGRPVNFE